MIGGTVIEVCDHPTDRSKVYVNVADRPYSKIEQCAIYVERNSDSERIQIGDSLWWQGRSAMWTPAMNNDQPPSKLKCGKDFDIVIPRIGYSGVSHPYTKVDDA